MKFLEGIPRILYKYRDWFNEHHRKMVFNQEIYFPSTSQFNDPYEGSIPYMYDENELTPENIFKKMLNLAKSEHPDWTDDKLHPYVYEYQRKDLLHDDKHIEQVQENTKKEIERTYGIFTLTEDKNNFLMWSHYANSHTGFCIGFDSHILFSIIQGGIAPVTYQKKLPTFSLFENPMSFSHKLLSTKSEVWEYENEFRIIKSNATHKTFKIPKICIVEIIFGCKMDLDTKLEILSFVEKELRHCEVYETVLNKEEFKLDTIKIY